MGSNWRRKWRSCDPHMRPQGGQLPRSDAGNPYQVVRTPIRTSPLTLGNDALRQRRPNARQECQFRPGSSIDVDLIPRRRADSRFVEEPQGRSAYLVDQESSRCDTDQDEANDSVGSLQPPVARPTGHDRLLHSRPSHTCRHCRRRSIITLDSLRGMFRLLRREPTERVAVPPRSSTLELPQR